MQLFRPTVTLFRTCAVALLGGCAFHSTATHWNGTLGPDGYPVFYAATTKLGVQLFVAVPFLGDLGIDGQVDSLTSTVAKRGGNHVRIVQSTSTNYWYGLPPVTWVFTPVVSTVNAEYRPSEGEIRAILRARILREFRRQPLEPEQMEGLIEARYREVIGAPAAADRASEPASDAVGGGANSTAVSTQTLE
jgi:hypothetical protein